jgi:hypothetical protein
MVRSERPLAERYERIRIDPERFGDPVNGGKCHRISFALLKAIREYHAPELVTMDDGEPRLQYTEKKS